MDKAISRAAAEISTITAVVDSSSNTKHHWAENIIVTALATTIALIPGVGPEASLALSLAYKAGTGAAGQIPGIVKNVWSARSTDPEQTKELENNQLAILLIGSTNTSVQSVLDFNTNMTLAILQGVEIGTSKTDYSSFLEFTDGGRYSDSGKKILLNADNFETSDKLLTTFTTYLISGSLAQNGFYAVLIPGLNPAAVYSDPSSNCPSWAGSSCNSKSSDVGCRGELAANNLCTNLWYSQTHKSSYLLLKDGKTDVKQSSQILQRMYQNNFASGESLFESAAICELQSVFPKGSMPSYTTSGPSGSAGFLFTQGSFPAAAPYANIINTTTNFLGIADMGFVKLSQEASLGASWVHPSTDLFTSERSGLLNTFCTAQLNVSIANSWGGKNVDSWTQNRAR